MESWFAENLNISNNIYDFYTISFGLRNTKNIIKVYRSMRVLRKILVSRISKIENSNQISYTRIILKSTFLGQIIVGDEKPYKYLVESIEKFSNQEELLELMKKNKFQNCSYRNLSGGIVAIHFGWKI